MNKAVANILAFFALSAILAAAQMQMPADDRSSESSAASKTLTGMVSDSMCGAQHMAKDKTAAECTRECVKQSSKYALVVGKKVYTLEGHEAELDKLAGMTATVKGKVSGDTVSVESVESAMKTK